MMKVLILAGGISAWKAGYILNKVSTQGNIFKNLINIIPGVESKIKGEDEGRINILLLGMRGENVLGGGLLADTIMIALYSFVVFIVAVLVGVEVLDTRKHHKKANKLNNIKRIDTSSRLKIPLKKETIDVVLLYDVIHLVGENDSREALFWSCDDSLL